MRHPYFPSSFGFGPEIILVSWPKFLFRLGTLMFWIRSLDNVTFQFVIWPFQFQTCVIFQLLLYISKILFLVFEIKYFDFLLLDLICRLGAIVEVYYFEVLVQNFLWLKDVDEVILFGCCLVLIRLLVFGSRGW